MPLTGLLGTWNGTLSALIHYDRQAWSGSRWRELALHEIRESTQLDRGPAADLEELAGLSAKLLHFGLECIDSIGTGRHNRGRILTAVAAGFKVSGRS